LGKVFIQNNFKRYIKEYITENNIDTYQVAFFDFSQQVIPINLDLGCDVGITPAIGGSNISSLVDFFKKADESKKILWLTDGYITTKDLKKITSLPCKLNIVLIGVDANPRFKMQLAKYIKIENFHHAENITTALDKFFTTAQQEINFPVSCKNFELMSCSKTTTTTKIDELDDWD